MHEGKEKVNKRKARLFSFYLFLRTGSLFTDVEDNEEKEKHPRNEASLGLP